MIDMSKYRVKSDVHRKDVTVRGIKDEVWVRRLPAADLRRYVAEQHDPDIEVRTQAGFSTLQKAICNEDGSSAGTIEDFRLMDTDLLKELIRVFQEVNAAHKDGDLGNA